MLACVRDMRECIAVVVLHEGDDMVAVELADVFLRIDDVFLTLVLELASELGVLWVDALGRRVSFVQCIERVIRLVRRGFSPDVVRGGRRAAEREDQNQSEEDRTNHEKPPFCLEKTTQLTLCQ